MSSTPPRTPPPRRSVRARLDFDTEPEEPIDESAPWTPFARAVPLLQSPPPIRRRRVSAEDAIRILDLDEDAVSFMSQPLNLTVPSAREETQVHLMQARDNLLYEFRDEPAVIARISNALRLAGFVFE